jgi:hypothetical protein
VVIYKNLFITSGLVSETLQGISVVLMSEQGSKSGYFIPFHTREKLDTPPGMIKPLTSEWDPPMHGQDLALIVKGDSYLLG